MTSTSTASSGLTVATSQTVTTLNPLSQLQNSTSSEPFRLPTRTTVLSPPPSVPADDHSVSVTTTTMSLPPDYNTIVASPERTHSMVTNSHHAMVTNSHHAMVTNSHHATVALTNSSQTSLPTYEVVALSSSMVVINIDVETDEQSSRPPAYEMGNIVRLNKIINVLHEHLVIRIINVVISILLYCFFAGCIVVAVFYINQQCDAPLTVWLTGYAVLGWNILMLKDVYLMLKHDSEKYYILRRIVKLFAITCVLATGWNILGATWIYEMMLQTSYVCPAITLQLSFWTITTSLTFAAVFTIFILGAACCCSYYKCYH